MWIATWKSIVLVDPELVKSTGIAEAVKMPYSGMYGGQFTIRIKVQNVAEKNCSFRIFPDDELLAIRLNGRSISIEQLTTEEKRNYEAGFKFSIKGFSRDTANVLEFDLKNSSGPAGFRIEPVYRISLAQRVAIVLALGLFGFFISGYLKISAVQKILMLLGIVASVLYLSKTDIAARTFDVYEGGGHRDYIEYLINHHSFPNPGQGWEYHQPPLYYLIAATAKETAHIKDADGDLWAQLLSQMFWTVFIVSGFACLRIALRSHKWALAFCSFALCMWPSGIIHSVRIGNDVALYAFSGLGLFYMIKWWNRRRESSLYWTIVWVVLAVITKSSGLALAASLVLLFIIHFMRSLRYPEYLDNGRTATIRQSLALGIALLVALAINFGDNVYYYATGASRDWLLSNVSQSINEGLRVKNDLSSYLVFDTATFLQHPFMSTWVDEHGRQYFWNFFWRSSLSSEFSFDGTAFRWWGISNGIALLLMLSGCCIFVLQRSAVGGLKKSWQCSYKYLPWLCVAIFMMALLLAFRIRTPLSCNSDFRYIYTVLLPVIALAGIALRNWRKLPLAAAMSFAMILIGANTLWWLTLL